jgi:hypothetical protein
MSRTAAGWAAIAAGRHAKKKRAHSMGPLDVSTALRITVPALPRRKLP